MSRTALAILFSVLLTGCPGGSDTPELGSVTGTVTLDKQPLPDATVQFTPSGGGRPASAVTESDGGYELMWSPGNPGATPGKYQVSITTASTKTDEATGEDVPIPEKVPAKYNAHTELEREVVAGSNSFNFDLDSNGEIYTEGDDDGGSSSCCCN